MTSAYSQLSQNGTIKGSSSSSTITGLSRWSVINKQLPPVEKIKALHVYDFDNTLFKTPLPNAALWTGTTIGSLSSQDVLVNGGWWHDSRILAATGDGADTEEKRAWEGWWNETIVELVRLTTSEKDSLCVLLTGRSERGFAELIKRMINSKGLEFDMVGLKPAVSPTHQTFNSTMHFKQLFLSAMMETYKHATEIRIYEDRPKHVKGFRDFLADFNRKQNSNMRTRGPITAEVIPVADMATTLDPVVEVAEVQHMINLHNDAIAKPEFKRQPAKLRPPRLMIKKTVFFTGYLLNKKDTETLINLAKTQIPQGLPDHELKFHANNILICPRPCPASILEKVGGMGAKMKWEVTGTACYENSIWAACLRPIPATAKFHTDNPSPFVVLALRKGARPIDAGKIQNWHPVPADKALVFETTVGEKVMLRIEPEDPREDEYESLFANKTSKRKHGEDGSGGFRNSGPGFHGHDGYYQQQPGSRGGRNERRDFHSGSRGGRGGFRGGPRGAGAGGFRGPRGNSRGGRGRGGSHHYKSLDDVEPRNQQGGYGVSVEYDEPSTSAAPFTGNIPTGPSGGNRGAAGNNNGGSASDLQDYY